MGRPGVAALQWQLTPLNWSGTLELRTAIDGQVANHGVERYRDLTSEHLTDITTDQAAADTVTLAATASQSRLRVAQAVRTRVMQDGATTETARETMLSDRVAAQHLTIGCEAGQPIHVEKLLAMATSRDHAISEPLEEACKQAARLPDFATLLAEHERVWRHLWRRADLEFDDCDPRSQLILRVHIFHLLQVATSHAADADVSIPARGLHGEAYRGHIFWDELFVFPFLTLRIPELTRALLLYRYRRLGEARHLAREAGYRGAMFPWQSGREGAEESQILHLNPRSGEWMPDNTHRQRHVNAAIAYNVWQYHEATGDLDFLSFYGLELLLEIARFWASIATEDPDSDRYQIIGVVGPDEFHTQGPDPDVAGLRNNAYTNVMASWCIKTALEALDLLPDERQQELLETLELTADDLAAWRTISHRLVVPFQDDGIISQFEGWDELPELDWNGLRREHGDIQRLDRILKAAGDDPNHYKATKQADVLMLFYLFSAEQLAELFDHLGYPWDPELIPRNVAYYLDRTSHGSTLSRVVHAWVLARSDRPASWHLFRDALASDVEDIQGGTTAEGVHLGAMAGTVDLVQRCYAGVSLRQGGLQFDPQLPAELDGLRFRLQYQGQWLEVAITQQELRVTLEASATASIRVLFGEEPHTLQPGQTLAFRLDDDNS